jgi:hypothetical protein
MVAQGSNRQNDKVPCPFFLSERRKIKQREKEYIDLFLPFLPFLLLNFNVGVKCQEPEW